MYINLSGYNSGEVTPFGLITSGGLAVITFAYWKRSHTQEWTYCRLSMRVCDQDSSRFSLRHLT